MKKDLSVKTCQSTISNQRLIYSAWQEFRRDKKSSYEIDKFEYSLAQNLCKLVDDIDSGTYCHGSYRRTIVSEKKRRDLAVACVRDRVVHRLIYNQLVVLYDSTFDPDVWSCRVDKGLHKCLTRTQQLLAKYPNTCVWRMDIIKFFDCIDHAVLRTCLDRRVTDQKLLWLCDEVITSYSATNGQAQSCGIPIGNLTSQVFANIYLNEFDRYVRHQLKPLAYARYGDDCILFVRTRREARYIRSRAIEFLREKLGLALNPKNDVIVYATQGLHFLGHIITSDSVVTDRHTTRRALERVNSRNLASYKSLNLDKWSKRELNYLALDEIEDLLH